MSWFDVVKIIGIPMSRIFLSNIVVNRAEFENTLNKLKGMNKVPNRIQGILNRNSEMSHKDYYDEGVKAATTEVNLSEEESKEMFEEMLQIIAEKTKEFAPRKYYTIEKIGALLSEAVKAKNNEDKDKVAEIILEITKNSPTRKQFWSEHIPERDRLQFLREYLEEDAGKAHLFFENPPSNSKILEDFAELIGGTAKDNKIFVNFQTENDFIRILRPTEKQQKQFAEHRANNKNKPSNEEKSFIKRFDFYNENIKQLKPRLKRGTLNAAIDPRKLAVRELNIKGAKFEIIGTFNERSVEKYLSIISGLKNSLRLWKPTEINGNKIIKGMIFLERGSGSTKTLVLNPYTSILLGSSFSNADTWFKSFFDTLRTNEVLTDGEVERLIVDDISDAIINNKDESQLKIRVASFSRLPSIRNLVLTLNDPKERKKRLNEAIRKIIAENKDEGEIGDIINNKKLSVRRSQLALLNKYFTRSEGKEIYAALQESYGDVDTLYWDSTGNETTSDNGMYVSFEVFGDSINNENISEWNENQEVESTKVTELRDSLLKPTTFVEFVKSIASKESINDLISNTASSAAFLEQINPKNSLTYLALMAERGANDEVGEAFNKIDADPNSAASEQVLNELNTQMPTILRTIRENTVTAFKDRLQFFLDNYGQKFQKVQVNPAIEAFKKANIIREIQ